jgi:hypothetical protein
MSPEKPIGSPPGGEESPLEPKAPVEERVALPVKPLPVAATLADPALEAEVAIAMYRGTTIADDGEWIHQDYHVDMPKRHLDLPAWPHTDQLYQQHVDSISPHYDSAGVGPPGPKPKEPKKDGPHTDISRGHVDLPRYHIDLAKGDHQDSMGMPHLDFQMPATSYHVDQFVGHQDEGTKDPEPKPTPDPNHVDT